METENSPHCLHLLIMDSDGQPEERPREAEAAASTAEKTNFEDRNKESAGDISGAFERFHLAKS